MDQTNKNINSLNINEVSSPNQNGSLDHSDINETLENWAERGWPFREFNKEITNTWIENGFTSDQAREWLESGSDYRSGYFIAWMRDQKEIATIDNLKNLNDDQRNELIDQFQEIYQDFVYCNWCWKVVKGNLMFFTDLENNLDFCSENCLLAWCENEELLKWKRVDKNFDLNVVKNFKKVNFNLADYQKYCQLNTEEQRVYQYYTLGWKDNLTWEDGKVLIKELELIRYSFSLSMIAYWKENNNLPSNREELNQLLAEGISVNYYLDWMYPINDVYLFSGEDWGKKRSEITYLNLSDKHLNGTLDLTNFTKLEVLHCYNNQLTQLILKDNMNLKELSCFNNKLTSLILPNPNGLVNIFSRSNYLTTFDYSSLNPFTLINLDLSNNNLQTTDLIELSIFFNLTSLEVGNNNIWIRAGNQGNQFTGSLQSLKNCTKLEYLYIKNTNIESGLEYLPLSLQRIESSGQIVAELEIYGYNLVQWQASHPNLMIKAGKEVVKLNDDILGVRKGIITPEFLQGELKEEEGTLNYNKAFNYSDFLIRDWHPFSWEVKKPLEYNSGENANSPESNRFWENEKITVAQTLPLRLYNISANQVEESELLSKNINYVILSYAWGDLSDKDNLTTWNYTYQDKNGTITPRQLGVYPEYNTTGTTRESIKSLQKAIATFKFINRDLPVEKIVNYIWTDQFCIDQFDNREKEREVPKMRQYYSNASVTLIAIDAEIGKLDKNDEKELTKQIVVKIAQSPWFHRSWTFQEGVLSKNTIFMFDDSLVDGRTLALAWGGLQSTYNKTPQTFITPLGWSYGNQLERVINSSIGEVLFAVGHRQQTVAIDSIYAILGLLPYGDKVKVEYKPYGQAYKKEELENKLLELFEQAYLCNPKQIITYLGERNPHRWWLPIMNKDGYVQINGALNEDERGDQYFLAQIKQVTKQGIQIMRGHLTILADDTKIVEIDRNDDKNNTRWNVTIQLILREKPKQIFIIRTDEFYYSEKDTRQELFIDMINQEVILKSENLERFNKLVNQSDELTDNFTSRIEQIEINLSLY